MPETQAPGEEIAGHRGRRPSWHMDLLSHVAETGDLLPEELGLRVGGQRD